MKSQSKNLLDAGPQIKSGWLPVLIGILLGLLVIFLYVGLDKSDQMNSYNKIKAEAEYLSTHVDSDLKNRIPTLQRMARRWEIHGNIPKEEFISDARAYLSDVPGFQALEWVDNNFIVRWIVPLEGNEKAQNLNLAFEQKRRVALEKPGISVRRQLLPRLNWYRVERVF
jgi:sensor domain CHASE-containing protein